MQDLVYNKCYAIKITRALPLSHIPVSLGPLNSPEAPIVGTSQSAMPHDDGDLRKWESLIPRPNQVLDTAT